jgi:hypothetical protein
MVPVTDTESASNETMETLTSPSKVIALKFDGGGTLAHTEVHDASTPSSDAHEDPPAEQSPNTKKPKPPNPHLIAAETAYKEKNYLRQLTEASAALEKEPRNRRAAFLAGDALLKSGDKVSACKFFRRSSKKHFRRAGCSD